MDFFKEFQTVHGLSFPLKKIICFDILFLDMVIVIIRMWTLLPKELLTVLSKLYFMVLGHNPPGHVPPGHLPQGHIPPGHLPPGHLPPGHLPPRTYTPWDIYPLDRYPLKHIRLSQTFETERKKLLFTLLYN